jgi:hypothetical protein
MKKLLVLLALSTQSYAYDDGMPRDTPIEQAEPEPVQTLQGILSHLDNDPTLFGMAPFNVCVSGECGMYFAKPGPASPTDTSTAVERIAAGLVRATEGRVDITFSYHEKIINANGSSTEHDVNVTIQASRGDSDGQCSMNEATSKSHK